MQKFEWNEGLSVGVRSIDEQHRIWIERLNNLSAAIASKQESRHVSKTLRFMMDYMEFHFSTEESLMESRNYPGLEEHRLEHRQFAQKLADLLALGKAGDQSLERIAESINQFQVAWLQDHINRADRQFAEFLDGRNEAAAGSSSGYRFSTGETLSESL